MIVLVIVIVTLTNVYHLHYDMFQGGWRPSLSTSPFSPQSRTFGVSAFSCGRLSPLVSQAECNHTEDDDDDYADDGDHSEDDDGDDDTDDADCQGQRRTPVWEPERLCGE